MEGYEGQQGMWAVQWGIQGGHSHVKSSKGSADRWGP
jgi:hypothetical protein